MQTLQRIRLLAVSATLASALAGCGNEYPKGWANIERGVLASVNGHGCPDITGTYSLHAALPNDPSWGLPTLLKEQESGIPGSNMVIEDADTLTVSGDANKLLKLTYTRLPETMERARERLRQDNKILWDQYVRLLNPETRHSGRYAQMTDKQYEDNLDRFLVPTTRSRTIEYGEDYRCSGGWLTTPRTEQDTPPRRDDPPRPVVENGTYRLGKDTVGYLVSHTEFKRVHETSLWCGDGCKGNIPLGTWTQRHWAHWAPVQPVAAATATNTTRSWAAPPRPNPVDLLPSMETLRNGPRAAVVERKVTTSATPEAIAALVTPLLPPSVSLESIVAGADGYKLIAFADTQAQVSQLMRNIEGSATFKSPDLVKTFKNSRNGRFETHIFVFERR